MSVEPWAPVPERYQVLIGLYLETPESPAQVSDSSGQTISLPTVTRLTIAPAAPLTLPERNPLHYTLGEAITLRDYTVSSTIQSNTAFTLTLYWRAQATPAQDYAVFVHLLTEDGKVLAQSDGPPSANRYPTSSWQAGDVVPDTRRIEVPETQPGQVVQIKVGMYSPADLNRLPIYNSAGSPLPDNVIPLFKTAILHMTRQESK
ncbi:MAG: hypothetical protein BWY63_03892 [Chloroflexi bacterium ADurb.Bin360]|nr:MAG: hypothetical protein BWY63_03892 [Chloroflexi bacterium ADurb.Bin360]